MILGRLLVSGQMTLELFGKLGGILLISAEIFVFTETFKYNICIFLMPPKMTCIGRCLC